jgi:hypothetical protein
VKDLAEKTNKSERSIERDIQIATRIPEKVQTIIKDLPVADNKSDLLKLSRLNEHAQGEIAVVLSKKKVETVNEAIHILEKNPHLDPYELMNAIQNGEYNHQIESFQNTQRQQNQEI